MAIGPPNSALFLVPGHYRRALVGASPRPRTRRVQGGPVLFQQEPGHHLILLTTGEVASRKGRHSFPASTDCTDRRTGCAHRAQTQHDGDGNSGFRSPRIATST